jgi:hypothetical protein
MTRRYSTGRPFAQSPETFWERVDRSGGEDACWPFTGLWSDPKGYRRVSVTAKHWLAHRYAHFLATGEKPEVVCHSCDNPPCCNPRHLFSGTLQSNMADCVAKGRHARGEHRPNAILTTQAVAEIKARWAQRRDTGRLATEFGVSPSLISQIAHGTRWKHVAPAPVARKGRGL